MKKVIILIYAIVLTVMLAGCISFNNTEDVLFYISNESDVDEMPAIGVEVYVDSKKIIGDTFKASNIQPHYRSYLHKLSKGKHTVQAKTSGEVKVTSIKKIEVKEQLYVFISFHYDSLDEKELKAEKQIFQMLHPGEAFSSDSLVKRKELVIHTTTKKPIHQ